jgi:hypothetical protein
MQNSSALDVWHFETPGHVLDEADFHLFMAFRIPPYNDGLQV